ncbi:Macrolide export protein MacA [bacterium HR31]|nr:Macrolide export protein MacA [bacterium HR31]
MRRTVWITILLVAAGLVAWRALGAARPQAQPSPAGPAPGGPRLAVVRVEPVGRTTLVVRSTYVGELVASGSADVFPRVSGVVQEVRVREGDAVAAGQVLVVLDPRELRYQVEQARAVRDAQQVAVQQAAAAVRTQRAQVEQAEANLNTQRARLAQLLAGAAPEQVRQAEEQVTQAQAAVEFSRAQLRRAEELYRQGFVAQQVVDSARTDLVVQEARLRAAEEQLKLLRRGPSAEEVQVARAQVRQAEAGLRQAQAQLRQGEVALRQARSVLAQAEAALRQVESLFEERHVRAPISGVVANLSADPGDTVTAATRLLQVVAVSTVEASVAVAESDLGRLRVGMPAVVRVDAFPDRTFTGRVARIAPVVAADTRTATVRVQVPNREGLLRPGMTARLDVTLARRESVLTVPVHAVVSRDGKQVVFVVQDGVARARAVQLGLADGTRVEVVGGLRAGERVVVEGQETLRDGVPVRVLEGPAGRRPRSGGRP